MRTVLVLIVGVALVTLCASAGFAQFVPDYVTDSSAMARGGTGVAVSGGTGAGLLNPAMLPVAYRVPEGLSAEVETALAPGGEKLSPAYAGVAGNWLREWGATDNRWDFSFRDGDRLALSPAGPLLDLTSAAHRQPNRQVLIQSRFVEIGQRDLAGLRFDAAAGGIGALSFTQNVDDWGPRRTFNATWGALGDNDAFAAGYTEAFGNFDFYHLSYGRDLSRSRVLAAPSIQTMADRASAISVGATVSYLDAGAEDGLMMGVGGAIERGALVAGEPLLLTGGVVGHNLLNEFSNWSEMRRRVDVGVAASHPRVRLSLDVRDVFNDTEDALFPDAGGTSVHAGLEVNVGHTVLGNTLLIGGIRSDEKPAWGVEHRIPTLGRLPIIKFMYSTSEHQQEVGLMVMITPRILDVRGE